MSRWKQALYDRSPTVVRSAVASAYGYCLRRQRSGGNFETLVQEALARDKWSAGQWAEWQSTRLSHVLDVAATETAHYASCWKSSYGRNDDAVSWESLSNWPILEKETVRTHPNSLIARSQRRTRLVCEQTSGTTGTPLRVWHSQRTLRQWYALFEARCRRWHGVSARDRWAILGGRLVKPVQENSPPYWVWNAGLRQLYMSTYHLSPGHLQHYLDALEKYRICYFLGYTSALYELALEALRRGRRNTPLRVVIANAEPVYDYQRTAIQEAFGCQLRETYGMSEMAAAASECDAGNLHLWPDAGIVEVCDEHGNIVPHGSGELLLTSLIKDEMPLVRYRIGDRGTLLPPGKKCPCGKSLPLLGSIDGRADDVLITARGDRVGRLDPVFKANLPIREAQVVQESLNKVVVKYVPDAGFCAHHAEQLAVALRQRLGDIRVACEAVDRVPRSANGKFRAVVSLLSIPGQHAPSTNESET
jgi:phenylacetate-CoA ligase